MIKFKDALKADFKTVANSLREGSVHVHFTESFPFVDVTTGNGERVMPLDLPAGNGWTATQVSWNSGSLASVTFSKDGEQPVRSILNSGHFLNDLPGVPLSRAEEGNALGRNILAAMGAYENKGLKFGWSL